MLPSRSQLSEEMQLCRVHIYREWDGEQHGVKRTPRGGSTCPGVWEVLGQPSASYSTGIVQGSYFKATRISSLPTGEEDMAVAALCSTYVLVKFKIRAFSHGEKAGSSCPLILCQKHCPEFPQGVPLVRDGQVLAFPTTEIILRGCRC